MDDFGSSMTEKAIRKAERQLSSVYRQAQREIEEKALEWEKRHKAREAKYRKQLEDGKLKKADFDAWMRGQVFQGKQWRARREQIDNVLLNADKAAANIINDGKIGVFAQNANYIGYGLEHDLSINTGFMLYDENTVVRLIQNDPQILPKPRPGVKKDMAFSYYNKLMSSVITQGIVQGETISEIARRIAKTTSEKSYSSAVRNARTAYTGAQNAGRIEGMHQAQRLGIEVKKKWLAILDSHTRDTHRDLDGQVRDVDEPFDSNFGKIMFPGDPRARPGNVYNCRCTLTYIFPKYQNDTPRRTGEGDIIADMTYREWEKQKRRFTSRNNSSIISEQASLKQEIGNSGIPSMYIGNYEDFSPLSFDETEKSLMKTLRDKTDETGYEYGAVIADGEQKRLFTSRLPDRVQIPEDIKPLPHLRLYHAHTSATVLSSGDLSLMTYENVDKVAVITNSRDVFAVYLGDGYRPTADEFYKAYVEIRRDVDNAIIENTEMYELTPDQRFYVMVREQAFRISRRFGWTIEGGPL